MDVWIVMDGDYDDDWIVGVFSNEAAANECSKHGDYFNPEHHEVLDVFIAPPPPAPEPPTPCHARIVVTKGDNFTEVPCELLRGHDGAHKFRTVNLDELQCSYSCYQDWKT